jgi:hypothetical protein
MRGWVYIAVNESFADMVKIGYTDRDPSIRLLELAGTGLPTPFRLLYSALVNDPERVEREVHMELSDKRVSPDREFFKCGVEEAVQTIKEVVSRLHLLVIYEEGGVEENQLPTRKRTSTEWRQFLLDEYRNCFRRLRKAAKEWKDYPAVESLVDQEIKVESLIDKFFRTEQLRRLIEDSNIDEHSLKAQLETCFERSGDILVNFRMVEIRSDKELSYEYQQMVSMTQRSSVTRSRTNSGFVCYFCKQPIKNSAKCSCRGS